MLPVLPRGGYFVILIFFCSQQENFDYLLKGADLVYHLPLSALLLHTLYGEDTSILRNWVHKLPVPPKGTSYPTSTQDPFILFGFYSILLGHALFNLAASHDGVGLSWCKDILTSDQIKVLMDSARERGGTIPF